MNRSRPRARRVVSSTLRLTRAGALDELQRADRAPGPRADHVRTPRRTRAVTRTGGSPSATRTLVAPVTRHVPAGGENSAT